MSFNISSSELMSRWQQCRSLLSSFLPESNGVMIFSRLNIYYFTNTMVNGVLWLPLDAEPVLLCRKGIDRARIESPLENILEFRTYRDIIPLLTDLGMSVSKKTAAEMNRLPWGLSRSLIKHFPGHDFLPADRVIAMTRAVKSGLELEYIRKAGKAHAECLMKTLPEILHTGMSELEISHIISDIFFKAGNHGLIRMEGFGEEVYIGHIAVGESANYPSFFNGPVGLRGLHPATPFMGASDVKWEPGSILTVDNGFNFAGYHTDKTQVYWPGIRESIPSYINEAHEFCIEIQGEAASKLRPGMIPEEIWSDCLKSVERSRWSEGFMGLDKNKVNFLGHGIGLVIDEYPVIAKGFDQPLETGMTIALEPKIGIRGVGMVGVENTFEVTDKGGKSLTGDSYEIICV